MNQSSVLFSAYLAPIQYFSILSKSESCIIDYHEHFVKQTYRSRCEIYSPNGLLTLSIPLVKRNHQQAIKDMKISYDYNWQTLHWRSLESSYRRSPFFEFYEDDFYPFYHDKKFEYLVDINEEMQQLVLKLLKLKVNYSFSSSYIKEINDGKDYRKTLSPKDSKNIKEAYLAKEYIQVFQSRHNVIPNLSIVDLLFNQGNKALDYL